MRPMTQESIPRPVQAHNVDHANATALLLGAAGLVLVFPGSVLGAVAAAASWRVTRTPIVGRWLIAALGATTVATLRGQLLPGWPWRLLAHGLAPHLVAGVALSSVTRSLPVELLLGPLVLMLAVTGDIYWRRTVHGQDWTRYKEMAERRRALERGWQGPGGAIRNRRLSANTRSGASGSGPSRRPGAPSTSPPTR